MNRFFEIKKTILNPPDPDFYSTRIYPKSWDVFFNKYLSIPYGQTLMNVPCVYMVYSGDTSLYIGRTSKLRDRMKQHFGCYSIGTRGGERTGWSEFLYSSILSGQALAVCVLEEVNDAELEDYHIQVINPKFNKVRNGTFSSAASYMLSAHIEFKAMHEYESNLSIQMTKMYNEHKQKIGLRTVTENTQPVTQ